MADVTMPQLGETVTEGTITKWFKQVGEEVKADEPLFEVSTDKVDTEVPSPVAGTLSEIRAQEGDVVQVGDVIAVVGDAGAAPAPEPAAAPAAAAPAAEPAPRPARRRRLLSPPSRRPPPPRPPRPSSRPPRPPSPSRYRYRSAPATAPPASLSPVVRRLVNEHGLQPEQIPAPVPVGASPRGRPQPHRPHRPSRGARPPAPAAAPPRPRFRLTAPAATAAPAAAPRPAPAPAAPAARAGERDESVKLSKIRTLTGDHMLMSLATSPHAFSVVEVDYANVDAVRSAVQGRLDAAARASPSRISPSSAGP